VTDRLSRVRARLAHHGAEAALLSHAPDILWAVGFTGSNAVLAITPMSAHLVTDGRYTVQAREETRGAEVHIPGYDLIGHIADHNLLGDTKRVAFQSDRVTFDEYNDLRTRLAGRDLLPVSASLTTDRASKDPEEIDSIRRSQAATEAVFDEILPMIAPGVTERDLAAEIVYQGLRHGASRVAFDPIVASGRRGALPHARPSTKKFASGELVLIDLGLVVDGYASDMTRTIALGEPEDGMRKAYEAVLDAQLRAIDVLQVGMPGREVDAVARGVLIEAGLADYFTHSVGHGVGIEVHEAPRLSQRVDDTVPLNAVVTIEPGVYLPERFGIRIEDLVIAREGGPEVITKTPKTLLVL
jgi:Xaa-Pro aminopeptidase